MVKNLSANAGDIRDTGLNPMSGRSSGLCSPRRRKESDTTERLSLHFSPLQHSSQENPTDRGLIALAGYSE